MFRPIPPQQPMADIIRWRNAAHAWAAVTRNTSGMATIKNRQETRVIGKLAVKLVKTGVGNCLFRRPIEVIRHQTLVQVVDFLFLAVFGNLRPMAAIEQDSVLSIFGSVQ